MNSRLTRRSGSTDCLASTHQSSVEAGSRNLNDRGTEREWSVSPAGPDAALDPPMPSTRADSALPALGDLVAILTEMFGHPGGADSAFAIARHGIVDELRIGEIKPIHQLDEGRE